MVDNHAMKWKLILRIVIVVLLLGIPVTPAIAASVDVTVTAAPDYTEGIVNFVVTYVSDTQLDLDWGFSGDAVNIMIRAKYGAYPDDIPDEDTEPSDGYLVYYGSGTSTSDTSMNFDESTGILYYKAWGQKASGKWYTTTSTDSEESRQMTLIALFVFAGIMTFVAVRSTYWILKFLAGLVWGGVCIYWLGNPPSSIDVGSSAHTAILIAMAAIAFSMALMPFWYTSNKNGQEFGRFKMPWQKVEEEEEPYKPTSRERNVSYQRRINERLSGRNTRY